MEVRLTKNLRHSRPLNLHLQQTYQKLLAEPNCDPLVHLYLACSYFFLGMYKESDDEAQKGVKIKQRVHNNTRIIIDSPLDALGPSCKLQNRLLFHLSHKFNDEKRLMGYHQNLQDVIEDQVKSGYQRFAVLTSS